MPIEYHRQTPQEAAYTVPPKYRPYTQPHRLPPVLQTWANHITQAPAGTDSLAGAGNVLLIGDTDTYKTTTAHTLAKVTVDSRRAVRFWFAPDLWAALHRDEDSVAAEGKTVDLLIIDDLTAGEPPTPTERKALLRVLNHRDAHDLPTVATMRGDFRTLEPHIGRDAFQRLMNGCHVIETGGGGNRSLADITQLDHTIPTPPAQPTPPHEA